MRRNGKLTRFERLLAIGLSIVWLSGGGVALYAALANARWGMAMLAATAVVYGAAWLRVATLARMLTWPELLAPWRPVK